MIPISGRFALSAAAALSLAFSQPAAAAGRMQETEPNGTVATASPLQMNANRLTKVSANIFTGASGGGDEDYYSFTAAAGDRVYAATMTQASASGQNDSVVTLYASDGATVIERDDNDGTFSGFASSIAGAVIPADGTYYLKVTPNTPTASILGYDLYVQLRGGTPVVETEPNDVPGTATAAGPWVQGSSTGDPDYYAITLNAGDTVFMSLDLDPERDGGWNGRLGLGLLGDAQNFIPVANDSGTDTIPSEAMFITVKEAGTYYALVDSVSGGTGTYHLSMSVLPALVENYTTYTSTEVPAVIPTGPGMISSSLTVPGNPRIAKIRLKLDVTHNRTSDLDIHLRSPVGNDIGIVTNVGSGTPGSNTRMDVIIDDDAAIPPAFPTLNRMILKPELNYSLGWLKGIDAGGTWRLDIRDDLAAEGGTLHGWSIEIIEEAPQPVGQTIYATDFESDAGGFTSSGTNNNWQRGTPLSVPITTANSGVNCWKTNLAGDYSASSNQDLISPDIDLSQQTGQELFLHWAQRYQIESAHFDHAYVQVEEVGGAGATRRIWEWRGPTMRDIVGNPNATIQESAGWANLHQDISDFAGKTIRVRFHFDSDNTVHFSGWAVDDVSVTVSDAPEIAVSGNTVDIAEGSTTPATADGTDFGTLAVASGSTTRTFTVTNSGDAPLNLATLGIAGAGVADFTVTSPPAAVVAAGGSTTFQIAFDPSVGGDRIATVSLTNNDLDENPFEFTIKGTGSTLSPAIVTASMTVSGTYHRQGAVQYVVTLTNSSPFPQLDNPGNEFVLDLPSSMQLVGYTIPAGQQATASMDASTDTVALNCLIPGNSSVNLTVNAVVRATSTGTIIRAQGSVSYDADGNGTNEVSTVTNDPATPAALDPTSFTPLYPDIAVFNGASTAPVDERTDDVGSFVVPQAALGASTSRTITLKNVGAYRLQNISAALSGANAGEFAITQPATGLNVGETSALTVTFTPVAAGPSTALLEILSDDLGETPFRIALSGEGANTNPSAVLSVAASEQGGLPYVTIGEVVTYRVNVQVVPGITKNLSIYEYLPDGMAYVPGSAALVTTGFSGTTALDTVRNPLNGTTFANGDDVFFNFADITCPVDEDPGNNTFALTFQARVLDVLSNVGTGGTPTKLATNYRLKSGTGFFTSASAEVKVTLREPAMSLSQTYSKKIGTAGDVLDVAWSLQHAPGSTSTAFDVTVSTTLPAGFTYVPGSFTGGTVAVSGQTLTFTLAGYPGSSPAIPLGFQVATSAALPHGYTTSLTAALTSNSLPEPGYGRSSTVTRTDDFMIGDILLTNATVTENNLAGTILGQLSALDANPLATYAFSLIGGAGSTDNASFTLTNGQLSLNVVADYEVKKSYSLRVRANGGSGKVFDKVLTISVRDVNEAPTITTFIVVVSTAEDTATAALPFTVGDVDNDPATLVLAAYSSNTTLVPVGNIVIGGSGTSRTVTVTPTANRHGTAMITLIVSDGLLSATETFPVTVIPVNDAPSFVTGRNQMVNEDAGPQTVVDWADDISPGPASEAQQTMVFLVTNDNNALFSAQPSISSAGTLSYTPAANAHGQAQVTVMLRDNGGTSPGVDTSAPQTFLITVNSVNDLPTVIAPGIADILHTAPGQAAIINMESHFTDVETSAANLQYHAAWAVDPEVFSVIRIGNSLSITGTGYGSKEIFITAIDPQFGSVMETVRVTVKSIPTTANGGIPDTVVSPAAPDKTLALAGYFQDQDGDTLSYAVQPGYDTTKVAATVSGSTLTLHPVAPGATTVTIRVTDTDGNFVDDTFAVTVEDPIPVLTPTVGSPPVLNRQTGMYEIRVTATNANQFAIPGFRIRVTSALPTGMKLHNSTAPIGSAESYVDALASLAPGQSIVVVLEFFSPTRNYAGFNPTVIAEPLPADVTNEGTGAGIAVTRFVNLPDGSKLLEFTSVAGRWYQIEYSADLATWKKSLVPIQAGANRTQWYDRGAPYTDTHPSTQPQRFYRVSEIPGH